MGKLFSEMYIGHDEEVNQETWLNVIAFQVFRKIVEIFRKITLTSLCGYVMLKR